MIAAPALDTAAATIASGLPAIGNVAWGSHLCQFYRSREDLVDTLLPFFRAGLAANEACLWITSAPLPEAQAREALLAADPAVERHLTSGQLEIIDHSAWYVRAGRLGPDAVLRGWLEREEAALASGYAGLRLSGNTFWLEREQWSAFADYESAVHRAFHGRRILALCSYCLDHCALEDIVDVLRNHKFALVRREGVWDIVQSATMVIDSFALESGSAHTAQFYARDLPLARLAEFLGRGLTRPDGAAVIIARSPNLAAVERALGVSGFDVAGARQSGRLLAIDAQRVLDGLRRGRRLDRSRFESAVQPVLDLASRFPATHVYGEIVDLLCEGGDLAGALELEGWWNDLLDRYPFWLLCGYSDAGIAANVDAHRHVAAVHDGSDDTSSLLLAGERRARVRAQSAATHLSQLQRVTSALSEAVTVADIGRVVVRDMAAIAGASKAVLCTPAADGSSLYYMSQAGLGPNNASHFERLPEDSQLPIAQAVRTGLPLWLRTPQAIDRDFAPSRDPATQASACLPLVRCGETVGAIGFTFDRPRRFDATERALFEDLARQTALAVDRARLYETAQHERARAESANRAKDEFLAMLGHELRNPLSPILTALELMRLRAGEQYAKERAIIERQVRHMSRLVDDLLDVSRITRRKVDLQRAPIELAEVVAAAIETTSPLLEERAHRLITDVPPVGLVVDADGQRLIQAVANLLTNAAKYTPPGGSIVVSAARQADRLSLRVRDSGVGIDADMLQHVFDLFVQGPRTPARSEGGLGLGLAIVRAVIELHGGTVRAHSDGPGRGSEFVLELPAAPASSASTTDAQPDASSRTHGALRILVVDDNIDAAEALAEVLETLGHITRVAYDGPQALAEAPLFHPHVALLDIGLPVMDGYELGARLREQLASQPPTLIAVTGYGLASDRERSAAAGFAAHLVKPLDLEVLEMQLARAVPAGGYGTSTPSR